MKSGRDSVVLRQANPSQNSPQKYILSAEEARGGGKILNNCGNTRGFFARFVV
jgi:hypothetical protein